MSHQPIFLTTTKLILWTILEKKLIVVRKGTKHSEVVRDTSKTSVSTVFCVSADGKILPPYTVYKAKHLYPTWVDGGLEGAGYNRNDSGWFDMPIFED